MLIWNLKVSSLQFWNTYQTKCFQNGIDIYLLVDLIFLFTGLENINPSFEEDA